MNCIRCGSSVGYNSSATGLCGACLQIGNITFGSNWMPMVMTGGAVESQMVDVAQLRAAETKIRELASQLTAIQGERDRLKAGNFTREEIHAICHNLHGTVSAQEFADGCAAEQMKLYGQSPDRQRADKAEGERNALAAWACSSCGARFSESVPAVALEGVTRCSSCVRAEQAEAELSTVREALIKVRAHTSYTIPPGYSVEHSKRLMLDLMAGLLASIERIVEAALQPSKEEK